ncbi:RNA helicase [Ranunculus cassubicifolius]
MEINLQDHEDLVNAVQYYLGPQPIDVLSGAVKEMLAVLKPRILPTMGGTEEEALSDVIDIEDDEENEILCDGGGDFEMKRSPKLLDLEKLWLDQCRILKRNEGMEELNTGGRNVVQLKKRYLEVHIPPLNRTMATGEALIKVSEMPVWVQQAFEGMNQLDRLQSRVYSTALFGQGNMLICAPYGSGVSDVAILTILMQIRSPPWKIITYLVHTEVRVAEVVTSLSSHLRSYNVEVQTDSGVFVFEKHRIIVTTPEKWEIAWRMLGDEGYIQAGKLLIIEQIHLLHDESRGPVLEGIVARTIRTAETRKDRLRLVAFCAPVPNYEDVAAFLRVSKEKGLFCFDSSFRPCPLAQQYVRITDTKPLGRFQLMNDLCYEKVKAAAGKRQILIYVHSMEETIRTASEIRGKALADGSLFLTEHSASREAINNYAALVTNIYLKELLPYGYAIYHTGMATGDCNIVKRLFGDGHVQVLVSTVEFAWHVNLPAHTVIVKGTDVLDYENGLWCELGPLDVMQMLGCARKALPNSSPEAVVLTDITKRKYCLALMNEKLPLESQFIFKLPDHLMTEILIGSVQNVRDACHWLSYTYFFIRMLKNPTLYGLLHEDLAKDVLLGERRADLVHAAATILEKKDWVKYDRKSGRFEATLKGRYASTGA